MGFSLGGIVGDALGVVTGGLVGNDVLGLDITGAGAAADAQRQASSQANSAILESTEKNIDFQKWLFGEQKDLTKDFVNSGERALNKYERAIDQPFGERQFKKDPGYQFRLDEGLKAVENSNSAAGMQLSGKGLKDIARWSQNFASNEFNQAYGRRQDYLNRLSGLVSMGQASATGQAQQAGTMGNQVSNSILAGGQSQAQNFMNQGNISASQSMSGFNTLMDIGGLAASFFGGRK